MLNSSCRALTLFVVIAGLSTASVAANSPSKPSTAADHAPLEQITSALQWRMIGPFRGGRTRALAGVPDQPDTFYIGAVDGGIWKTDDAGRTWNPIFDAQPTQSIGALAVAPSDPNIVYAASGEGLH